MNQADSSRLQRSVNEMPEDVRDALERAAMMQAYQQRPAYQRNDYLGWISQAKLRPTREKRIAQMLEELRAGGLYMNMRWNSRR